jgi:2-oxoglutarate ferredoxin oxidoreductase subunit alpha
VSVALAGSGGSGVMTRRQWLLDAAARAGLYGLMVRTSGPQIRGGEAAALLRSAPRSRVARRRLRRAARDRLAERAPLRRRDPAARRRLLVCDADGGESPRCSRASGARVLSPAA